MADPLSIIISSFSLVISFITAWLTLFRQGTIQMTQPTVIFFGPDTPRHQTEPHLPKVYLRTLLFSTSKRGRIIESMHIALFRNETHQNFNVWVYSEGEKLVRGSGLFVGETGISAHHHFLTPKDGNSFRFTQGQYQLDFYARLLGDKKQIKLFSQQLNISNDHAKALEENGTGLYFDWGPDSARYIPHIEKRSTHPSETEEPFKVFVTR